MKIAFLDFDGVVVTERSHFAFGKPGRMRQPDPIVAGVMQQLGRAGVQFVVSSTWRIHEQENTVGLMGFLGLSTFLHSCPFTPRDTSPDPMGARGREIAAWMDENGKDVESYRIVDDDHTNILPAQMPYFIRCIASEGLSSGAITSLLHWARVEPWAEFFHPVEP